MSEGTVQNGWSVQVAEMPGNLNPSQQQQLLSCVAAIQQAGNQVAAGFAMMGVQLARLRLYFTQTKDFEAFCYQHFQLKQASLHRLVHVGRIAEEKFKGTDGVISYDVLARIGLTSTQLIKPDTPDEVVEQIKAAVSSGEKLSKADLQAIISRVSAEASEDLAAAQAEVTGLRGDLAHAEAVAKENEREAVMQGARADRALVSLSESEHSIRMLNEEVTAAHSDVASLTAEIERLSRATTIVTTEKVEVVPEGYTTAKEAVDAVESQLAAAKIRLSSLNAEIEKREEEAQARRDAEGTIAHLNEDVGRLFVQYSPALLQVIASSTPAVKNQIADTASRLRQFLAELDAMTGEAHG